MPTPTIAAIAHLVESSQHLKRCYDLLRAAGETDLALLVRGAQLELNAVLGKLAAAGREDEQVVA